MNRKLRPHYAVRRAGDEFHRPPFSWFYRARTKPINPIGPLPDITDEWLAVVGEFSFGR